MSREADQESLRAWSALRDAAARVDSEPRLLEALRSLRRRLPGDEKFGDPLSTAGETTLALVARGVSGLQPPERDSALSELGMTGLQVWQSLSEGVGRGRGEQDLALLFTDLVDFSRWVLAAGDSAAVKLLQAVSEAVEQPIIEQGGRIQKRLGDGLLATFLEAPAAVEAAVHAQEALAEVDVEGYRPRMRAGVHWGRPRRLGGDYLGQDIGIAATVGECARPGQVLVSEPLLAQLDGELDGKRSDDPDGKRSSDPDGKRSDDPEPDGQPRGDRDAKRPGFRVGRRRRLRSSAAPRGLQVAAVERV